MSLSQTAKSCVLCLAIVPLAGASLDFDFSSSRWVMLAAAAIILLPIVVLVMKQMLRARREYPVLPAEVTSERISNHLVVLSSAAVLAVYSAGYLRTRSAADRLAARDQAAKQLAAHAALVVAPAPAAPVPEPDSSQASATEPAPGKNGESNSPPSAVRSKPKPARSSASGESASSSSAAASTNPGARFKDGIYQGRGSCPHGDIVAQVAIRNGQIAYAGIADCLTRYSCSVIKDLPMQVVVRQSTGVDVVSGATESTEAFQDAVTDALSKADTQAAAHPPQPAGQTANPPGAEQTQ